MLRLLCMVCADSNWSRIFTRSINYLWDLDLKLAKMLGKLSVWFPNPREHLEIVHVPWNFWPTLDFQFVWACNMHSIQIASLIFWVHFSEKAKRHYHRIRKYSILRFLIENNKHYISIAVTLLSILTILFQLFLEITILCAFFFISVVCVLSVCLFLSFPPSSPNSQHPHLFHLLFLLTMK